MASTMYVALTCFTLLLGEAAAFGFDKLDSKRAEKELDLDERLQSGIKCFWTLMCNKDTVLDIKKDLNVITDFIYLEAVKAAKSVIDPSDYYPELATLEQIKSDDTWVNLYRPLLCGLSEEKRNNYTNALVEIGLQKFEEICQNAREEEDCARTEEAMLLHNKMVEQKKLEGVC